MPGAGDKGLVTENEKLRWAWVRRQRDFQRGPKPILSLIVAPTSCQQVSTQVGCSQSSRIFVRQAFADLSH